MPLDPNRRAVESRAPGGFPGWLFKDRHAHCLATGAGGCRACTTHTHLYLIMSCLLLRPILFAVMPLDANRRAVLSACTGGFLVPAV
jgi:hypothetical protein